MTHPALAVRWERPDATQYAALSFLARYRGDTLRAYKQDLRAFLGWCADHGVEPLQAQRPQLELYLRWMEQQGLAPATIGRRFTTVAGFYRYAVIDGHCPEGPVPSSDATAGAVGGAAPHRAPPARVRRPAHRRPPRR